MAPGSADAGRGAIEVLEPQRVVIADAVGKIKSGQFLEVLDEVGFAGIVQRVPDTAYGGRVVENRLRIVAPRRRNVTGRFRQTSSRPH